MSILNKNVNLKDIKIWKSVILGIVYTCSIFIIIGLGKSLIKMPFDIANEYNIKINKTEQIVELLPNDYTIIILGVLLIAVLTLPMYFAIGRIKKISKDGGEFYRDDEIQTDEKIMPFKKKEYKDKGVRDIILSDDDIKDDDVEEERLINNSVNDRDDTITVLKCENIKSRMLPLTREVTMSLYNHCPKNITREIVLEYVKRENRYRIKKNTKYNNEKMTDRIIDFLKKNDIIESDDGCEDKFYFTVFGSTYMKYFITGKI